MRVVIDTNVLASGLLNPFGAPGRVVDRLLAGALVLLFDDRILAEYPEVLRRPRFGFDRADLDALLEYIETSGEPVIAMPLAITLSDPDDVPFPEVAEAGVAERLVTGNGRRFLPISGTHAVPVVGPADLTR